jgi:hypothetical protein
MRRFALLLHWRQSQLLLRLNYARKRPSDWQEVIPFLKRAGVEMSSSSTLSLLLPKVLPKSWTFWDADPPRVEKELIEELRRRSSG